MWEALGGDLNIGSMFSRGLGASVRLLDEFVRCLFLFMFILLCGTWGTDYGHMAVAG